MSFLSDEFRAAIARVTAARDAAGAAVKKVEQVGLTELRDAATGALKAMHEHTSALVAMFSAQASDLAMSITKMRGDLDRMRTGFDAAIADAIAKERGRAETEIERLERRIRQLENLAGMTNGAADLDEVARAQGGAS